jgi:hypothetical protein
VFWCAHCCNNLDILVPKVRYFETSKFEGTGVILFVFAYDAAIRVLGYRWAVVNGNRLLDMIDILIIFLSIVVYIWMLSFNSAGITKLVTFARIIRLLRLLKLVRTLLALLVQKYKH